MEQSNLQERIMCGDLLQATQSQQNVVRRLFYVYVRAQRFFTEQEGEPDPNSVEVGLRAAIVGLLALTKWLKEIPPSMGYDYPARAVEMETWLKDILSGDQYGYLHPDAL